MGRGIRKINRFRWRRPRSRRRVRAARKGYVVVRNSVGTVRDGFKTSTASWLLKKRFPKIGDILRARKGQRRTRLGSLGLISSIELQGMGSAQGKKAYSPVLIGTSHSRAECFERDKGLLKKLYNEGARTVGMEITEELLSMENEQFSTYFTDLARYATSIGMRVVPLLSEDLYMRISQLAWAKNFFGRSGNFQVDELERHIAYFENDPVFLRDIRLMSPEGHSQRKFVLRQIEMLKGALAMIESVDGNLEKFADLWNRVMFGEVKAEMTAAVERYRSDVVITGLMHARQLSKDLNDSTFVSSRREVKEPGSAEDLIMNELGFHEGLVPLIYAYLLRKVKIYRLDTNVTPQVQLMKALKARPEIIRYSVRVLSGKKPAQFMPMLDPTRHLYALKLSCRDAERALDSLLQNELATSN